MTEARIEGMAGTACLTLRSQGSCVLGWFTRHPPREPVGKQPGALLAAAATRKVYNVECLKRGSKITAEQNRFEFLHSFIRSFFGAL